MDIPLDATLDDLKKIINDKRNIPQDNLYTLFHFRSNDEIDEENDTSKVTDLLKINEADQEYHIDLSHDCAAPVAVMIRGNGNNYWPPESSPCNFFIITGHQKQNNFEYAEVTHNFSQYCITSVSSFRFWVSEFKYLLRSYFSRYYLYNIYRIRVYKTPAAYKKSKVLGCGLLKCD